MLDTLQMLDMLEMGDVRKMLLANYTSVNRTENVFPKNALNSV